jgi:hypothetical protein
MDDEIPFPPQLERRSSGPLEERVTRLEEQFVALSRLMERQIYLDGRVHRDLQRIVEKYDERADREHDAVLLLGVELRSLVKTAAIVGGIIVVIANIAAPLAVRLIGP